MQQYLSAHLLSLSQLKQNKNYVIKLTNATHFTIQIDNQFKHGFQYVYQLWPCRRGSHEQIRIQVSTITNGQTVKIGEASPTISHSVDGESFKFYQTSGQQDVLVFTFKVIKLNIPENASKTQQLRAMNQKMQIYLKQCKDELRGYKQFLYHTNNVIKELSKDEQANQYQFGRFQSENEEIQGHGPKDVAFPQKPIRNQETVSVPKQKSQKDSNKSKPVIKQQANQTFLSTNKKPKANQLPLNEPSPSNIDQSQIQEQILDQKVDDKSRVSNQQENNSPFNTPIIKASQRSQRSQLDQIQSKFSELKQKSSFVSNAQSKLSSSRKDSLIKHRKKQSLLSKFSYLQRHFHSNNLLTPDEVKQQAQQSQNEAEAQVKNHVYFKSNNIKPGNDDKDKKKRIENQVQKVNVILNDNLQNINTSSRQKPYQLSDIAEQIKKRREAYKNIKMDSRKNTIQASSISVVPQTIQQPKTPKKPATPIAELNISAVNQYESRFHQQNPSVSMNKAQYLKQVLKSSIKNESSKNKFSTKALETQPITDKKNLQRDLKTENFEISHLSLDKSKQTPIQKQEIKTQKQQDQLVKHNKSTDVTNPSEMRRSRSNKMASSNQFKLERRKKHVNRKTQPEKQSVESIYHFSNNKNHKFSKQNSKIEATERPSLDTKKLIMKIWSIKVTTFTLGQAKSKRCLLENGSNKFQTNIKETLENYVEWDDKIKIKHMEPHSCLYINLLSLPYKNTINEGCATILLAELIGSKTRQHKAYLYKDNLAVGNIEFKYTIQEQDNQMLAFSLPEIKKQQYSNKTQVQENLSFKNSAIASRHAINSLTLDTHQMSNNRLVVDNGRQNQPYVSKIKQSKKRRYLQ